MYCPGRKNIKKLPELPESFSFEAQVVEPQQFNDQRGLVSHLYVIKAFFVIYITNEIIQIILY